MSVIDEGKTPAPARPSSRSTPPVWAEVRVATTGFVVGVALSIAVGILAFRTVPSVLAVVLVGLAGALSAVVVGVRLPASDRPRAREWDRDGEWDTGRQTGRAKPPASPRQVGELPRDRREAPHEGWLH